MGVAERDARAEPGDELVDGHESVCAIAAQTVPRRHCHGRRDGLGRAPRWRRPRQTRAFQQRIVGGEVVGIHDGTEGDGTTGLAERLATPLDEGFEECVSARVVGLAGVVYCAPDGAEEDEEVELHAGRHGSLV